MLQFLLGLSDRQAAESVRCRIDFKYAMAMELDDPGFHHSVLADFRDRLAEDDRADRLLDLALARLKEAGLVLRHPFGGCGVGRRDQDRRPPTVDQIRQVSSGPSSRCGEMPATSSSAARTASVTISRRVRHARRNLDRSSPPAGARCRSTAGSPAPRRRSGQ
ncbi:transposase [Streptomyces europaeiscabiei]|uniref:transposase n=1 Tax=Streptomyces europaeiscabiei TaxID=146819 RepID=UPI001FD41E8E|nr:transposase [Streptomyces europaeiscabiei]MDX2758414.1 transposase [Streptomyces europaeiscabiei]MDX2770310.1 transposase [Streptomyces europaeiscabiei]